MSKLFYIQGTGVMAPSNAFLLAMTARMVQRYSVHLRNGHVRLQPEAVMELRPMVTLLHNNMVLNLAVQSVALELEDEELAGGTFLTTLEEEDEELAGKINELVGKVKLRARKLLRQQHILQGRRQAAMGLSEAAELNTALAENDATSQRLESRLVKTVSRLNKLLSDQETWFSGESEDPDEEQGWLSFGELMQLLRDDGWETRANLANIESFVIDQLGSVLTEYSLAGNVDDDGGEVFDDSDDDDNLNDEGSDLDPVMDYQEDDPQLPSAAEYATEQEETSGSMMLRPPEEPTGIDLHAPRPPGVTVHRPLG